MLIGRSPFPNNNNAHCKKWFIEMAQYIFNLHESCFTNINYDLKVCFIINFCLTKSSRKLSLLWKIDTFVKSIHAKYILKLHKNIKLLYIMGFYKAIYQNDG